jgi:selenocysteine lyase/cysteine desulfurase
MTTLETHFQQFRENIVGIDQTFSTPLGEQKIVYADWTASGRLYRPIERTLLEEFGPFVGNTHSESNVTGTAMTIAYHKAHDIIKRNVNASSEDALLFVGNGMTSAINKFQRILGLKVPEQLRHRLSLPEKERPVVFVTHMEHHSNQTSWCETIADVHVIKPMADGTIDVEDLKSMLHEFRDRPLKIGAFTACSNVTGVRSPYHQLARLMHEHGGISVVDFAASAPYDNTDMHPADPLERLDAITFSPHKFLGGPGSSGVLIFHSSIYQLNAPDQPGGGTVLWTNPWSGYRFNPDIEIREDGGTPGFLQGIKAALAVELKEEMNSEKMNKREEELVARAMAGLRAIPGLHLLADNLQDRQSIFSFYFDHLHYNLVVRLLNDRFGVQVRGGCSCAGTYGHYLLHVDKFTSKRITDQIDAGDLSAKPGWVRLSLHPTTTNAELEYILDAVKSISELGAKWKSDYRYDPHTNEFIHAAQNGELRNSVDSWFRNALSGSTIR